MTTLPLWSICPLFYYSHFVCPTLSFQDQFLLFYNLFPSWTRLVIFPCTASLINQWFNELPPIFLCITCKICLFHDVLIQAYSLIDQHSPIHTLYQIFIDTKLQIVKFLSHLMMSYWFFMSTWFNFNTLTIVLHSGHGFMGSLIHLWKLQLSLCVHTLYPFWISLRHVDYRLLICCRNVSSVVCCPSLARKSCTWTATSITVVKVLHWHHWLM